MVAGAQLIMTTRAQLLDRIRTALNRSAPLSAPPTPPPVDDAIVRTTSSEDDLPGAFAQHAADLGIAVHRTTSDKFVSTLLDQLAHHNVTRLVAAIPALPDALRSTLDDALRAHDIQSLDWRNDRAMTACFDADASLTDVAAALADSGSILCRSDPDHGRGLWLVPPVHIAVVRASDILPDLIDLASRADLAPSHLPPALCLISGPSKTADIEGILVTGVHGPGHLVVLLLDDA
jgi:L-lactate dehydrogenase complex protein LldG